MVDSRREIPRTDAVLGDPRLASALADLPRDVVRTAVTDAQQAARDGEISPYDVVDAALDRLPSGLRRVINATGVVLHTNLGRAPLSDRAIAAVAVAAAGYVDVELDLATGTRAPRGRQAEQVLRALVPGVEAALVVNNGAAALVLAALAGGGPVAVSRGELVEIGDGFRLTTILEAAGVELVEVGSTNRTRLADYREAVAGGAVAVLKVHPSNFRVEGFAGGVSVAELAGIGVDVLVDVGSGLLRADPQLPSEPDVAAAVRSGAAVVTFSGDKLLGGAQAGIAVGRSDVVTRMRRHPLARAFRVDKLTLAALAATLTDDSTPVRRMLEAADLEHRARSLAAALQMGDVVATTSAVGGGSGPGVELASWAISLPEHLAAPLRQGEPPVVGRAHHGRLLLDLRTVAPEDDDVVAHAVRFAAERG